MKGYYRNQDNVLINLETGMIKPDYISSLEDKLGSEKKGPGIGAKLAVLGMLALSAVGCKEPGYVSIPGVGSYLNDPNSGTWIPTEVRKDGREESYDGEPGTLN